jgi:hypothetical protein
VTRLHDWEARLQHLLATHARRAFAWGVHDCLLWAAAAVDAVTGVDHAARFRGRYTDAATAAAVLRDVGRGTLTRTLDHELRRSIPAMLGRGDIAMIGSGRTASLGVVIGADAMFVGDAGLEPRARAHWTRGWHV